MYPACSVNLIFAIEEIPFTSGNGNLRQSGRYEEANVDMEPRLVYPLPGFVNLGSTCVHISLNVTRNRSSS